MMKTLFLQPPSFDGFDGGAGSRYQAKREIKSFWFGSQTSSGSMLSFLHLAQNIFTQRTNSSYNSQNSFDFGVQARLQRSL